MSKIYINREKIDEMVKKLADKIIADYNGEPITLIGVLNGAYRFFADLSSYFPPNTRIDFVKVSSYEGTESVGEIKECSGLKRPIKGENVIVVEDIVDTGKSMNFLLDYLNKQEPKSLKLCSFLDKPSRRDKQIDIKLDYVVFEIPDYFVIGYGLDYNEQYRTLKDVEIFNFSEDAKVLEPKIRI